MSKTHEDRENQAIIDHANSTSDDLYALLNITEESAASKSNLTKAWRKIALKWHPDKNRGNEQVAAAELHRRSQAYEVLSDPAAKQRYDEKRWVKQQREAAKRMMSETRRMQVDDLLRKEGAVGKRKRELSEAERKAMEEENKKAELRAKAQRAKAAWMDKAKKAREEEKQQSKVEEVAERAQPHENGHADDPTHEDTGSGQASEEDRTVKVRWTSWSSDMGEQGAGMQPKDAFKAHVKDLFSKFGEIEEITFLSDRMLRPTANDPEVNGKTKNPKKRLTSTVSIQYKSLVDVYTATTNAASQARFDIDAWRGFESCERWNAKKSYFGPDKPIPDRASDRVSDKPQTNGIERLEPVESAAVSEKRKAMLRQQEIERILREEDADEASAIT